MKPTGSVQGPPRADPYLSRMMPSQAPSPDSPLTFDTNPASTSTDASDPTKRSRRRARMATVLPLLAGAGLLLAACSGGSSASGSTTSTTAAAAAGSFQAYATCLRSHGANFPTGGGGGTPGSGTPGSFAPGGTRPSIPASERSTFEKAASACASLRPKGGSFPGGGGQSTAFAAYRNCLKLHGVTLPSGGGGFGGGGGSTTTSTTTPKIAAAEAACATLRPKGGFGRGGPGSTTTTS
jgi:hypothetical protein